MPDVVDRLRDAARAAAKAPNDTTILLSPLGFRVWAVKGKRQAAKHIPFSDVEISPTNLLAEAVSHVNRQLA